MTVAWTEWKGERGRLEELKLKGGKTSQGKSKRMKKALKSLPLVCSVIRLAYHSRCLFRFFHLSFPVQYSATFNCARLWCVQWCGTGHRAVMPAERANSSQLSECDRLFGPLQVWSTCHCLRQSALWPVQCARSGRDREAHQCHH